MLVLSRKDTESIIISDGEALQIVVKVLSIKGKQVRFGIVAPPEIAVHREEIHDKIQAQKEVNENE